MTPGEALKAALHDAALDPRSTQDEQRWLGNLTYHLTGATADRIAEAAERLTSRRLSDVPTDLKSFWEGDGR